MAGGAMTTSMLLRQSLLAMFRLTPFTNHVAERYVPVFESTLASLMWCTISLICLTDPFLVARGCQQIGHHEDSIYLQVGSWLGEEEESRTS